MHSHALPAFRLGDVRGRYPEEIDEAFAHRFARAFVERFGLQGTIATGRDMRASSEGLQAALIDGLVEAGLDVIDMGLCPTELGYFASTRPHIAASIVVTASHNPAVYNGLKCVLAGGQAITFNEGLADVMYRMLAERPFPLKSARGTSRRVDMVGEYIHFLGTRFRVDQLDIGSVALNGLNGTAATLAVQIADSFDLPVTWFRREPGPIPDEGADPAKPRLVAEMKSFMTGRQFDLGVSWDGDCDRCVFFDSDGDLVPTYYVVGLLAEKYLQEYPGRAIVYDTKLCWNTLDIIDRGRGIAVPSETGHAFVKQHMRASNAIYGGELSSHHFFGEFAHCDSGMFAWLKTLEILHQSGDSIRELIAERRQKICCTPEINVKLVDVPAAFEAIDRAYRPHADATDDFDGPSYEMSGEWRFSLRQSKTEPVVRLNFESRGNADELSQRALEVLNVIRPFESTANDHTESVRIL